MSLIGSTDHVVFDSPNNDNMTIIIMMMINWSLIIVEDVMNSVCNKKCIYFPKKEENTRFLRLVKLLTVMSPT